MYGRCETDPFDQATDVCDSCYGEFCSACMVKTKRRKHPICRECAIVASGVRPGTKPLLRGSKKTAAERRKTLQAAPVTPRAFEYFDDQPGPTSPDEGDQTVDEPVPLTAEGNGDGDGGSDDRGEDRDEDEVSFEAGAAADHGRPGPADADGSAPSAGETSPAAAPEPAQPEPAQPEPAQPGPVLAEPPTATGATTGVVTPGLAALAKHQADRRAPTIAPESVPAPEWLTESIGQSVPTGTASPAGVDPVEQPSEADQPTRTEPAVQIEPAERRRGDDKPVTDGFDWVTKMPPRGSSTPLPSRSGGGAAAKSEAAASGGVATADRQQPSLPKRRSKLRPTVES